MKDAVATMGAVLPDDAGGRDAVHVAVISVVAGEKLFPGQDIGFAESVTAGGEHIAIGGAEKKLGIVDPFVKGIVLPDQRFWLYIYPRKITGLNHQWSHPDIPDAGTAATATAIYHTPSQKLRSEEWLRDFCDRSDCPKYETLITLITGGSVGDGNYPTTARSDGDYLIIHGEDATGEIPPEFWDHVEIVTGKKIEREDRASYFSCSC